jgi:hypothetical protein
MWIVLMSPPQTQRRILVAHAASEAIAPMTRVILAKMGYAIVTPEEFETLGEDVQRRGPELRIVDERNLGDLPDDNGLSVPLIVLTGRHGVTGADPRILGAVRRPAAMHELFRILQETLEDTPRATPRVPTHLAAVCQRGQVKWRVSILSLSENGCLLRSPEPLKLGSSIQLSFVLPRVGQIAVAGETAYQLVPDMGVIFESTSPAEREAIVSFVTEQLAA